MRIWASLPSPATGQSFYGQRTGASLDEVSSAIRQAQEPMAPNLPALPSASNNNGTSTVTIDINHNNAPAGVTMTPSLKGDGAEIGGVNVRRAMPEAGTVGYGAGLGY